MKKHVFRTRLNCIIILLLFISICVTFFSFSEVSLTAYAEEIAQATTEEELEEIIREQIDKLDLEELQKYVDSLDDFSEENVGERLIAFIKGANFDYKDFGKELLQVFFARAAEMMPAFLCIAAVSLLSGLLSMLKSGAGGNTATEMIFLITYAGSLIPLIAVLTECLQEAFASVSAMSKQMQVVFPLMLTLMATSGGSVSAAVCRPAVGFFSTTIVGIIENVVFPLTVLIIVFSMASNLTKELKIGKFTEFFKSINKWIIGVSISVFGLFFTLQGITSATYDGVARRAAKYAIGNGIPIVGGFLSGGFDLAVAGSVLIKNSLGSMSIFLMLSVLFEPLILLITVNLMLKLVAAITQPFGDSRISDFLEETAKNLNYCMAGLLFTAFLYFLSVMMMIYCTEALF